MYHEMVLTIWHTLPSLAPLSQSTEETDVGGSLVEDSTSPCTTGQIFSQSVYVEDPNAFVCTCDLVVLLVLMIHVEWTLLSLEDC